MTCDGEEMSLNVSFSKLAKSEYDGCAPYFPLKLDGIFNEWLLAPAVPAPMLGSNADCMLLLKQQDTTLFIGVRLFHVIIPQFSINDSNHHF